MSSVASPAGITAGPDGNLWFVEFDGNRIGRMTPAGVFTEFVPDPMAEEWMGWGPQAIAAGPDGNMWFRDAQNDRIGRITTRGSVTWFRHGVAEGDGPDGIAAGPDGAMWFTVPEADRVGRITMAGDVTEFRVGISRGSAPAGITAGPDGNLWFVESGRGRVARITPAGVVTEFGDGVSRGSRPVRIAAGPDGNLWFTELEGGRIGRITPAGAVTEFSTGITPGAQPLEIAAGPDGNLWFTEFAAARIGRITPGGVVTEFAAGLSPGSAESVHWGRGSYPFGITAGPDGNMWFTEYTGDRIGRITPAGVVSEFPSTAAILGARLGGERTVVVTLRCPSAAVRPCGGTLRLNLAYVDPVRRVGVRRVRVAPGRRVELVVPLWTAGLRRLRSKGLLSLQVQLVPGTASIAGSVSRYVVLRVPRSQGSQPPVTG